MNIPNFVRNQIISFKIRKAYTFYNSLFEGVLADTEELKRECYKLRYEVYCLEHSGYENAASFPDGCESDEYDQRAVHMLLRYRETGAFVGTARLILQPPDEKVGALPVHKLCRENNLVLPELFPLRHLAEISRFCIIKDFRRRAQDTIASGFYSAKELENDKKRIIPSMSLGLMGMIIRTCRQYNVKQVYAEMEPFLLRLLDKLGFHWTLVGSSIEYHGKRHICYATDAQLDQCKKERPEVWDFVTDKGRYSDADSASALRIFGPNGCGLDPEDEIDFTAVDRETAPIGKS